jgi:hypothetical protein
MRCLIFFAHWPVERWNNAFRETHCGRKPSVTILALRLRCCPNSQTANPKANRSRRVPATQRRDGSIVAARIVRVRRRRDWNDLGKGVRLHRLGSAGAFSVVNRIMVLFRAARSNLGRPLVAAQGAANSCASSLSASLNSISSCLFETPATPGPRSTSCASRVSEGIITPSNWL